MPLALMWAPSVRVKAFLKDNEGAPRSGIEHEQFGGRQRNNQDKILPERIKFYFNELCVVNRIAGAALSVSACGALRAP